MRRNELGFRKTMLACLVVATLGCGGIDPVDDQPAKPTNGDDQPAKPMNKGACFEVFGPSNLSHSDPAHDFGQVPVGGSQELSVHFYNFCNDEAARVLTAELIDPGSDTPFHVVKMPEIGTLVGTGVTNTITFKPTTGGTFSAVFHFAVSHGYYDVKLKGTAVVP